MPLRCLIFYKQ